VGKSSTPIPVSIKILILSASTTSILRYIFWYRQVMSTAKEPDRPKFGIGKFNQLGVREESVQLSVGNA